MAVTNFWKNIKNEVLDNKFSYSLLFVILVAGFILRIYRIDQLLGFYFDQGRDALVIWDFLHKGELFLIGPTTGIEGIYRGPWYYWLITPFYFLGNGNPVWPSVFLSLTTVIATVFVYIIGTKAESRTTGLIAALITSFSFNLVMASRWLSNPTPMLLLSVVLVWAMIMVSMKKKWGWPIISFISGLSLFNFGSSGEVFYFPAILIFAIWQRKNLPDKKNLIISIILFAITVLPLVLFDLIHKGILRNNISDFFFADKSFNTSSWRSAMDKLQFYYQAYSKLIFNGRYEKEIVLFGVIAFTFTYQLSRMIKNTTVKILLILFVSSTIGLIFFQGNFGNIYDYYLTGYFLIFILLFSLALGNLWRSALGKVFVVYFLYLFLTNNIDVLQGKLSDQCIGDSSICFLNQKQAIDYIHTDSENKEFNYDVYVPPVIDHAYKYLVLWKGTEKCGANLCNARLDEQVPLLYTLYEVDPPHPERLETWLARQKGIGVVEETKKFGGITVERRKRI